MKKIIPFGDRILVKRQKIGDKIGSGILHAADQTAERLTEIAQVVAVPDNTLCDKGLLENAESIIQSLENKIKSGDSEALLSLLRFNDYLRIKALRVGDKIFLGKYVGTDFNIGETGETLSIVGSDGIYGVIVETKKEKRVNV